MQAALSHGKIVDIDAKFISMIDNDPQKMPFANAMERELHFWKHGEEFGATDSLEYERLADTFMDGPLGTDLHECIRPSGLDRVRFDFGTHFEGVACTRPEFLRTFYTVSLGLIARHGGEAGYFVHECGRIQL